MKLNYEAAQEAAKHQLVDYETGWCTYDGYNSRPCCTAWGKALRLFVLDQKEFEEAIVKIVDASRKVV